MLHSLFGSNRPVVMTVLIVPAIAAGVLAYYFGAEPAETLGGPLFDLIFQYIAPYRWLRIVLGLVLILANAALLNGITNRHNYAHVEHFFPALVFFFFSVADVSWVGINAAQFANLFFLLALRRLLTVYRVGSPTAMLFDAGLFLGLAVLFFPLAVFVLPILWLGLMRLRSFNLREWLVPIVGIATPVLYAAVAYWWWDYTLLPEEFYMTNLGNVGFEFSGGAYTYAFLAVTLLIALVGLFQFISEMNVSTVHRKNTKSVFLWFALLVVFTVLYGSGLDVAYSALPLLFAPLAAVFMGVVFVGTKRVVFLQTGFYIWILCAAIYLYFTLGA